MKIGVIHATNAAVRPLEEYGKRLYPDIEFVNYVDETLLDYVNERGEVSEQGLRAFMKLLLTAAEDNPAGILIACSVYCQYRELFSQFVEVPFVAIDEPMIEEALGKGHRIGIVATTKAALPVTRRQILEKAAIEKEKTYEVYIEESFAEGAMDALRAGNVVLHDRKVAEAAKHLLEKKCDVVVLCQISMARAVEAIDTEMAKRVLTSPETGLGRLVEMIFARSEEKKEDRRSELLIGCIADDFTGASDAASFFKKGGLQTVLYTGTPKEVNERIPAGTQAVVIALKSRMEVPERAVRDTLEAAEWMERKGISKLYIKYCSTFDCMPEGNIGPVCDAIMEKYNRPYTLLCPSLPVNGRTVRDGNLYVNGIPLAESSMKNHPLTPMWDSYIPNLMSRQSKYFCYPQSRRKQKEWKNFAEQMQRKQVHFYLIPDYETAEDGDEIVSQFGDLPLLTGGSGLLEPLARQLSERSLKNTEICQKDREQTGKTILVAGSCSLATQEQVRTYLSEGGRGIELWPEKLLSGKQTVEGIVKEIQELNAPSVLVYSSGSAGAKIGRNQNASAQILEDSLAEIVKILVENVYTQVICAGGETSGAVTRRLGYQAYEIGESVAPGVPVLTPLNQKNMRLVLKSGNFGQPDFFLRAVKMTKE